MAKTGSRISSKTILIALVGVILIASALIIYIVKTRAPAGSSNQPMPIPVESAGSEGEADMRARNTSGFKVLLSEGQPLPQDVISQPVATGEPLSPAEIEAILSRLPVLPLSESLQSDFQLPTQPIPPPRPGQTVEVPFPPDAQALPVPQVPTGPLQVLRYSPEGDIPLAPFVSVTFNQPMVPLISLENLSAADVPVKIEPALQGVWRWLGTQTLTFETESDDFDRLPKATVFQVSIPAGTKSMSGGVLEKSVSWSFRTPPPVITSKYPVDIPQPLDPIIFIAFDQQIDPAAVLETIQVQAGGEKVKLALAQEADIQANETLKNLAKNASPERWLAFRPVDQLPADTAISVTVGPGTPSAEGPLTTTESQSFNFRTYAPLRVIGHGCAWGGNKCPPLTPFFIRFNNPINPETFQEGMLRIEPSLPGASVNLYSDTLQIQGASQGRTTYTVYLSGDIQDIFGQTLGKEGKLTFQVGSAEARLYGPQQSFVTLDPAEAKPSFSVYAINYPKLELKIYAVQPSDWPTFKGYLNNFYNQEKPGSPPGRLALEKTLAVESPADALSEVKIDLSQVMDGDFGHFIVTVTPPRNLFSDPYQQKYQTVQAWVQATQIGVDAFSDHREMVVWTTALGDGAPLEGVSIAPDGKDTGLVTGESGIIRFAIPEGASYLVASRGADHALLPRSTYAYAHEGDGWHSWTPQDELRWFVFDDRQMYRPGEQIHLKGWLRRIGGAQSGDVSLVGDSVTEVNYRVISSQGNDLGGGQAAVSALGGFDLVFQIPDEVNLGPSQIILDAAGKTGDFENRTFYHSFQIQEFRRPEFEVTARNETPAPYFAGDQAVVAVEASYYAGGPLPNAAVTWRVYSTPASYSPPNWSDFVFGEWEPRWFYFDRPYRDVETTQVFTGTTDAAGSHYLRLDFESGKTRPYSVQAEASVMDVNRQAWTGGTNLLVHPANLYVGLRSQRYFVQRGDPLKVDVIVTDLDGTPAADRPVEVQAARLEWKYRSGSWQEEEADIQTCKAGSKLQPVSCTFQTTVGGTYRITATVTDGLGRQNQTRITRWVSGAQRPPARKVEQESVTLIPDKETYQPGDTAEILVQSPFSPAEGLLTVSRSGMLYNQRFVIEDGTVTLRIPIEERHIPNLEIQVDLVGAALRSDDQGEPLLETPKRPAYARGSLSLDIPPLKRTLEVQANPQEKELEPGGETTIDLVVKDASGEPVSQAEITLVVVDEAVLALTNYQLADPLSIFYTRRQANFDGVYGRASIVLADPLALAGNQGMRDIAKQAMEMPAAEEAAAMPTMMAAMPAPGAPSPDSGQPPIALRTNFDPLAVFAPQVTTDENGAASVTVVLPDNLTRYRIMAVAVDGSGARFGSAENSLTARLPLMVRPSAPRFLNFGDIFELPVVLQNQTNQDMLVDVVLRAANLELTGASESDTERASGGDTGGESERENVSGLRVTIPARDRVEVRFPAAAQNAGKAVIQVAAVAGEYADAATIEFPVYTPTTSEAFATYGVIDAGAIAQPVAAPGQVFPQFGGLEINTSSTALQALTDAVLYLVGYPYECSEQLASRILAVAALRDVLSAFQAEGLPSAQEIESAVQRDIQRLQGLQNPDGGIPYWRRGQESIPFHTIHTAHALQRAALKGYDVPADMLRSLRQYLVDIEKYYPSWYRQETRRTLSAYALYVRDLMGDADPGKAMKLIDEATLEKLSLDAIGWLWPVLQDAPGAQTHLQAIRLKVNNSVVETAGAANFTTAYDDQNYLLLGSNRRTDAILLDALILDNPQHDLIPKLVNGLLGHAKNGRWGNTQENLFVLLAMDRYFNTYEAQTPDFIARIWLGETYAGEHEYRGRTTERDLTSIPMSYLVQQTQAGEQNLVISKEGDGRLYYRLGLKYAPVDLEQKALDMGFVVQRVYEALDDPQDVRQDADGVWHIRAGARVRVRITMVANNRRYHVALADPLPAGLEIINPALAVSESLPQNPESARAKYGWWWWGPWYEHQNMRDERAEAFTSLLWDGVYQYSYIARATTPGRFIVPPTKAEEMYSPEVFGRSASDVVVVE